MPPWAEACLWGLVGGAALVLGAVVAWRVRVPQGVVAGVMAFGAGVLISALAFELVATAEEQGGLGATVAGFLLGAVAYVAANEALARLGARHRKRSGGHQPSEAQSAGSGAAIAVGAPLDGIPESVVLGLSVLGGEGVGLGVLLAMVADTMIREAVERTHRMTELVTALGFSARSPSTTSAGDPAGTRRVVRTTTRRRARRRQGSGVHRDPAVAVHRRRGAVTGTPPWWSCAVVELRRRGVRRRGVRRSY